MKSKILLMALAILSIVTLGGCDCIVNANKPLVIKHINYLNNKNKANYFISNGDVGEIVFTDARNKYNVGDTLILIKK